MHCFFNRNGVLSSRELEEEYGEDLSFLLARLKMLCENETVCQFFHCLFSLSVCVCVLSGTTSYKVALRKMPSEKY